MRHLPVSLVFGLAAIAAGCHTAQPNAETRYRKALALYRNGDFKEAREDAHTGRQGQPLSEWYWRLQLVEAEALIQEGKSSQALDLLRDRAPAASTEFEIRRQSLTARALFDSSKFEQADTLLAQAKTLAKQYSRSDLESEADVLSTRSLATQGRFPEAETAAKRASREAQVSGEQFTIALALNTLGVVWMNTLRYDEAIDAFGQAEKIYRREGAGYNLAGSVSNIAICYYKLGDYDKALTYFENSRRTLPPSQVLARALNGIGGIYLDRGEYRKAISYFQDARAMSAKFGDRQDVVRWSTNITQALIALHEWDEAERVLKEAMALNAEPGSRPYFDLDAAAIALGRKRFEEARSLYLRVLALKAPGYPSWRAYAGIGDTWLFRGKFEEADKNFEAALHIIDTSQSYLRGIQSKFTFLGMLIDFYQSYVDSQMMRSGAARSPEKALAIADSSRAHVLALGTNRKPTGGPLQHYRDFNEIARKSNSVWLSYWLAPSRSFLWVTTAKETKFFLLPKSDEIAKLVEDYRVFTEKSLRDPLLMRSEAGDRLYQTLILPAAPMLPPGARVIIVPDGALHQLSFETLPVYGGEKPHYWMDDVTIAIAPSFGVFQGGATVRSSQRALIVGNPISPGENFPPLKYAAQEMESVSKHFPAPGQRVVVTGADARPDNWSKIKPGDFDIIHIAAHAEANSESPLDSAVILSRGSGYRLYAHDIADVPLHADLVTLSACRSAGARTYGGEGLVGLTWAFLQAGSRSVVAGLWDVSDASTAMLMEKLYAGIAAGSAPADALQSARLALRKTAYSKPFYWGAFQCYLR